MDEIFHSTFTRIHMYKLSHIMSWNNYTPYIIQVKTFDSQMIRKDQRKNEYELLYICIEFTIYII